MISFEPAIYAFLLTIGANTLLALRALAKKRRDRKGIQVHGTFSQTHPITEGAHALVDLGSAGAGALVVLGLLAMIFGGNLALCTAAISFIALSWAWIGLH